MALGMEVFNSSSAAGASSSTINLGTMGVNRIALLFVYLDSQDAGARPTVTGVSDANGLTWALYKSFNFDSADPTNVKQRLEIWWAYCAAQQTANTVTVTASVNSRGIGLGIGAISGVPATRYTAPFDADPTLPGTQSNPSGSDADAQITFSTHDSQTVGIVLWGSAITNGNAPATPSGWTSQIALGFNGTGSVSQKLNVYGIIYNAQQVGTVVDLGAGPSMKNWGMIVVAAGGTPIFPHSHVNCAGF